MRPKSQEEITREATLLGLAMLGAQRVEFALYGAVSHLTILSDSKRREFRTLTPEKFLRGNAEDCRATLGLLVREFGDSLLLTTEDLEKFVRNRNLIAHDFWRLAHTRIRGGRRLADPEAFLRQFLEDCLRWDRILQGLIATMRHTLAAKLGREINLSDEELAYAADFERNAMEHLRSKSTERPSV